MATAEKAEKTDKLSNGEASIPDSIPLGEPEPDNSSKFRTLLGILRRYAPVSSHERRHTDLASL